MAEDGEAKSGRSRFLSKSKWGKVFKESDAPAPPGHTNSFKLNEDVVDFLKPSTEKNARPKINIAVASRWPEAHEVRRASEATPPIQQQSGYRKPPRRPGLTVGFAKSAPEIIGEGGDDATDPPAEVSRKKSMMPRSVSDRRPGALVDGTQWPGTQAPRQLPVRQAKAPSGPEEDFRPQPVRRVQTSHNEFSPPVQRKHASPPLQEPPPPRPGISRAPTGFSSQDELETLTPIPDTPMHDEDGHYMSHTRPSIDTRLGDGIAQPRYDSARGGMLSASPRDPSSPAIRRQRDMQANEGMALRRASALYTNDGQTQPRQDADSGLQPSTQFYNALSRPAPSDLSPEASLHSQPGMSPDSKLSPDEPSPFADPKYIKRRSGEMAPAPRQPAVPQPSQHPGYLQPAAPSMSPSETTPSLRSEPPQPAANRQPRNVEQPSYMRATQQTQAPVIAEPRSSREQPSYMRATQPPDADFVPSRPPPALSQNMSVPQDSSRDRSRSPMRDRIFDSRVVPEKTKPSYSQPNHSGGSPNNFAPSPETGDGRSGSREETSSQVREPASSGAQLPPSPHIYTNSQSPQNPSPRSSMLGPGAPGKPASSPYACGPSPADYFSAPRAPAMQPARSPAANLRQEEATRPSSSGSTRAAYRPAPSPQPPTQGDPAAGNALTDFAGRVAHMKGVFKLTAERERPADRCSPEAWLRAALWWYLQGKAGLEVMLQRRPNGAEGQRELLTQPHVDLAKAWWIISDPLGQYDTLDAASPQSAQAANGSESMLRYSVALLRNHLNSLASSMLKNQLMPPHQSLIQGQDTSIWLDYPRFTSDAATVLSGSVSKSLLAENIAPATVPLDALPIGDTRETFCYNRFTVDVSVNTDEADTDRVVLPCMLTILRGKRDYQTSFVVSSQSELVSIQVGPRQTSGKGLTWHEVSWKASSQSMVIHLPRGFDLTVRMQERDFRAVWNLVEYSRKVEHSLRPAANEKLVHEAQLAEIQYADSSGANAFPQDKLRSCNAYVFEHTLEHRDGSGVRKMHRGYRLLLATNPGHKSLSSVSHEVCKRAPLLFEFLTDAAANGTTAMVLRVREENRQCRILLVFPDLASRQGFYDVLNGLEVGPDETIVGKMVVTGVDIQLASQTQGFTPVSHPALQALQWQKLGVTNSHSDDPNTRIPKTVQSDNLRVVARHTAGCITDRLNLGKGELLLRVPCADSPTPTVQILRKPQEDLTMSIDSRQSPQQVIDGIVETMLLAQQQPTIRTFTFASPADLHAFQAAITGFAVRYDGVASTFGISRRMMVVPIYHKLQASKVRLQIVTQSSVTQVLAFMEDFAHADALCFKVKSTDTFETVKGDSKGKKWAVKMVDAKFSLPKQEKGEKGEKNELDAEERVRRRFVNLEGLDYAEEHDDITIGFDNEQGMS